MNRKDLMQYIKDNYTLSGAATRILDATLDMINIYGDDDEHKKDMAGMVLDEIGCSIAEIKSFFD